MDLTKAQRLLNKIQAFLDDGAHELSRLEKDLIKSYVQQLYDAVVSDEPSVMPEKKTAFETPVHKSVKEETHFRHEAPAVRLSEISKPEPKPEHKPEPPKVEVSQPEIKKEEPYRPSYTETTPVHKTEISNPAYSEYMPPAVREKPVEPKEYIADKPPVAESKPYQPSEPVKESVSTMKTTHSVGDAGDALSKLFDLQKTEESRFGHVPIASIESAMGLNERIFTLNELFGGDKSLFDAWVAKLNSLNSFAEARNVLISGPAKDFKWTDPQRIKMAEQFIRIVSRRYPKPAY